MSTPMEDPVYQRLMKALSGIVDSLQGEQTAYQSFLDLLIRNEWVIKERGDEAAVDHLRTELVQYIELLESAAAEAGRHMDSVLDGVGPDVLCERMEQFSQLLKTKQSLQNKVGEGVKQHLSSLPAWDDNKNESDG